MLWTLKKIRYRILQFLQTCFAYLLPWRQPALLQGPGSIRQLPALIKSKKIDKVLIVSGGTLPRLGTLDSLYEACNKAGLAYVLFDGARADPSVDNVEQARQAYLDNHCQAFIAFGGGSPMDCAKAAAARIARPGRTVAQMGGVMRVRKHIPLLFAVPTTAGTGSETSIAAVVSDAQTHHKYAISDLCLIPRYAVLDPELTVGLPPNITANTGMDALTHAVEAYTNRFSPRCSRLLSEKAVKLIFDNITNAYRDGTDLTARSNMLLASFYAGAAFTRAGVGNVHALAHTLGGLYGTPHGLANAVLLPYVLEAYDASVYPKLARLATLVGITGQNDAEKARAFIREIRRINRDMNIVEHFDFIADEDIPQMVEWATNEANPFYPVPVIWNKAAFTATIDRVRKKA